MNTKRIIALLIAAVMVLSMIPVMAISTAAAGDGEWTVYQGAGSYPSEDDDEDAVYPPVSGYEYSADGFTIVQPDWTDVAPFVTATTKDPVNLKDGFFVKFRVDDYTYDGGNNADQWICLTINTGKVEDGLDENFEEGAVSGKIQPGSPVYGGGWLTLLRGIGNGTATNIPHITDPKTEDFGGTFVNHGGQAAIEVPMDDEGREIYTLEVQWTGSGYEIKVNGVVAPGAAQADPLLNKLSPDGNFFVGITMMTTVKGGRAGFTVLEYGTSEAEATKPVGSDSRVPDDNEVTVADIIDPSTVEANKPAILWNPDTYKLKSGNNVNFTAQGDNTWKALATEQAVFFNLSPKRGWSYNAEDFPVFGIMFKNLWVDSGTLWYAAGEIGSAHNDYTMPFSVYEGEFFGEDEEYIFVPVDLAGLWEGRINTIRLDMAMAEDVREFELCFAGMFRSTDEAYEYAKTWLSGSGIDTGIATEEPTEEPTEAPTDAPVEGGDATEAPTDAPADGGNGTEAPTDAPQEGGCGSIIGFGAMAILAAAAAAVALKKD